jgi:hypothetical protein
MFGLFLFTCYGFAVGEIKPAKCPRSFSQHFIQRKYDIFFLLQSRTKGNTLSTPLTVLQREEG